MADWFKFYENGIHESRFQWAIHEESGVCPVWLWILSECCRNKAGLIPWKGADFELFGISQLTNITVPKVNMAIGLLVKIEYISIHDGMLEVLRWNKFQSDYMRKLSGHTPDTVRTLSGHTPDKVRVEERRGEEKREEKNISEGKKNEESEKVTETPSQSKSTGAPLTYSEIAKRHTVVETPPESEAFVKFVKSYPKFTGSRREVHENWIAENCDLISEEIFRALEDHQKSEQWMRGFIEAPSKWIKEKRWQIKMRFVPRSEAQSSTPTATGIFAPGAENDDAAYAAHVARAKK